MSDDELDDYGGSDEDKGFSIGDSLEVPQMKMYTTQELHTLIHEGVIDLNPPYQRDVVWTPEKQSRLLDSIYRNFYVPPIVFAIFLDDDGQEVRKCVDGKQRLSSIQGFFDGVIPYRDPMTKKAYYFNHKASSTTLEVPQYWKRDFASKQVTCVEYRKLTGAMERDVFQRVQLGMPLTAAERLQAISSPWSDWISSLDTRYISNDDGITKNINIDVKRGRHFQSIAQLVYCCHGIPEQRVPTAPKLETWISNKEPPPTAFKKEISDVLTEFFHLTNTKRLSQAFTRIPQRVAPIEFVFIGVLLYILSDCTHEQRAEEVYSMRVYIRKAFPDAIRTRVDIVKKLWVFISEMSELYDTGIEFYASAPARKNRKKRAARDDDDDEDDYERGGQPKQRRRGGRSQ